MVELRLEKKRPVLLTYGLTHSKQDVHKLSVAEDKNITNLLSKENSGGPASVKMENPDADRLSESQIAKYADIIKSVCRASKTISKTAVVSLPVSSIFHAVVTLPAVKKEEIDHLIRAEVKKLLPMPLEEMALDYQVLESLSADKSQRVLINAVPHKLIEFYTKIFQRAGLVLDALEPESTALTRCLVGRDQAVAMIIDVGAERTNFFIIDQGAPITHQSIESGGDKIDKILQNILGVERGLTEQIKRDLFDYLPVTDNNILS